jgi:hypothetical protein
MTLHLMKTLYGSKSFTMGGMSIRVFGINFAERILRLISVPVAEEMIIVGPI